MLERGEHVSFANCGLPYYAGGSIGQRDALLLQTPESLWSRFRLDVRTRTEVLGVDRATREVTVRRPGGTVGTEGYDVLVLSPGARPIVPEIPGVERALVLRDVSDVDRVVAGLRSGARSAVIVGGGFIGVEMAEQLRHRGLDVTLVELADQVPRRDDKCLSWQGQSGLRHRPSPAPERHLSGGHRSAPPAENRVPRR